MTDRNYSAPEQGRSDVQVAADLIRFSEQLADAAAPVAMDYFRNPLQVEHKSDDSPVTIADRKVESIMREMITARFPQHGIFGEEHGRDNVERPETWVLDPIDGTKSFITGMPTFGTLIAFLDHGRPVLGVVDMPAMGERWLGVAGRQTTLNGTPCRTRSCQRLTQANLYSTSMDLFDAGELPLFEAVSCRAAMRRFGGDCYSYGLLASGHVDVVMESSLEPYDYLSLVAVIEGAGGVISDWQGRALSVESSGQVIAAATPALHREIMACIAESSNPAADR